MHLIPYDRSYLPAILELFINTVHYACDQEYSLAERLAWAPNLAPTTQNPYAPYALDAWHQGFSHNYTLLAISDHADQADQADQAVGLNVLIGFGDLELHSDGGANKSATSEQLTNAAYLDHLFAHEALQHNGIGSAICKALFAYGREHGIQQVYTHASLTARPFMERVGFEVVRPNEVDRRGITLKNFVMCKNLKCN